MSAAGSWGTYRTGLGVGGPSGVDKLYYRVDVSQSQSDGYVDDSGYDYTAAAAALRYDATDDTTLTLQSTFLKDSVSSYYGTPLLYDAVIDQNGTRSVRRASSTTDRLENARIDSRSRRLNYNNTDNFSKADNSFTRFIVDSNLSERWTLRNETYVATQHLDWRNTESTVWNPATQLVERGSFFLIYRNDLQIGNRVDLRWSGTLAGRPNTFLIGALYDDNEQIRNSGQTYAGSPTPANVPLRRLQSGHRSRCELSTHDEGDHRECRGVCREHFRADRAPEAGWRFALRADRCGAHVVSRRRSVHEIVRSHHGPTRRDLRSDRST